MIRPYINMLNIFTSKTEKFYLSYHESAIDYMKSYRKLVGFYETDHLYSDLRTITPIFGSVFHCGDITVEYSADNWTIQREEDFCKLVATYAEQARLSNEIDNL